MMNFNGQLKTRKVNLGGGFKKSRSTLIQNTQKEREKRDHDRRIEHNVVIIQKKIRRFLKLLQSRLEDGQKWSLSYTNDLNTTVFTFNSFYSFIFKHNEQRLDQINQLILLLTPQSLSELREANILGLYNTAYHTLGVILVDNSTDLEVLDKILTILQFLPQVPSSRELKSILPSLIRIIDGLQASYNHNDPLLLKILDIINLYATTSINSYVSFLSYPYIPSFPNFQINFSLLSSNLPSDSLNTDQAISLLHNFILNSNSLSSELIFCIARICSSIDVSLTTKEEQSALEDGDLSSRSNATIHWKVIPQETFDVLKTLYNREFISFATENTKDPHTLSLLYGSLINLLPSLKSTFIIYFIPKMFGTSLDSVLHSACFKKFVEMDEDSLFVATTSFLKEIFVDDSSFIFNDLQIFLELLKYRLIISNDFELFTTYGFTVDKFKALALFLKRFVFNLIWNHQKIVPLIVSRRYKRFKELVTSVITQIYLKDARQKVLPKDIWLVNINKISNIIDSIVLYEKSKDNDDDMINSDEERNNIYIATLSPEARAKVQIYLQAPFFIPFETRVKIFQALVQGDKQSNDVNDYGLFYRSSRHTATIRREHLLEDAFNSFDVLGSGFKHRLSITFENETGIEAGIDGGGLTKELLTSLAQHGFSDLFVTNANHELYPNPQIGLAYQYRVDTEEQFKKLQYIKFLGRVIGKCLYERILVDITFASFFLTKFNSGYRNSFDDLRSLDAELYSSLVKLLSYSEEELEELHTPFTIDERIGKKNISIDLIPNGSLTFVNGSNKLKFIHELSNYKLNKMISLQSNAFLSGLFEMISRDWLSMFNPYELQMLISGEKDVDIADLKRNTVYNGYDKSSQTIKDFWDIVENMEPSDKFQLVKFVTSVPRAPLLGFKALNPMFAINRSDAFDNRLPTASTCVNLLQLPDYQDKATLKKKLLYAINAEAGFDLI